MTNDYVGERGVNMNIYHSSCQLQHMTLVI